MVVRVVEAAAAVGRRHRGPSRAYQRQHDIAAPDGLGDRHGEVDPGLDVTDVHEHLGDLQVGGEGIVEPAGVTGGVVPAVADEDPQRHRAAILPGKLLQDRSVAGHVDRDGVALAVAALE